MIKETLDKFDTVAKNYKFEYEDLAREIFKKGLIVGYKKAQHFAKWEETGVAETGALGITYKEIRCSSCGWTHMGLLYKFCPGCGAQMTK